MPLARGDQANIPAKTAVDVGEPMVVFDGVDSHLAYADGNGDVVSLYKGVVQTFLPSSGLLAHYTFDTDTISGNTVLDQSGNGNDVTFSSIVSTPGRINEGVDMSSADAGYITNPFPHTRSPFSISVWLAKGSVSGSNQSVAGTYYTDAVTTGIICNLNDSGNVIEFYMYASGTVDFGINPTLPASFDDNGYHHLVYQTDGITAELYYDGALLGSDTHTVGQTNNSNTKMGILMVYNNTGNWGGLADNFRIYDRALSESEIIALSQEA